VSNNQQVLQKYAEPILISSSKNDITKPLSFREWFSSHRGINPNVEFKQYNEYLVNWYKNKSQTVTDFNLQIKLNYLALLKQLQLFFDKEETENWYNKVDVDSEKELLLAIPYFAKKLKDITFYYLKLREKIKQTKLKYNQVGTNTGIIQQIQRVILEDYSKNNTNVVLPFQLWSNVPQLSSLNQNLSIQIEELYDFHSYFDRSPTLPVSAYFDVNSSGLKNFLTSKNLSLTSTNWIYKLGNFSLSADETEESDILELSKLIAEKYLGEDKFLFSETPSQSAQTDFYDLFIYNGNNYFFWPGVVYEEKALSLPRYKSIALSAFGLETLGTAGSSIELADTIFVKTQNEIKGAWLRNHFKDYKKETMKAVLDPASKTSFRFPFPGFGLSGENLNWTDFSLETDKKYKFLDDANKRAIEQIYWSNSIELTSINPILLNDSTLIENKAYAHRDYNHADKIKVWDITPEYNDTSTPDAINESWLYRFDATDISIKGDADNVIFWPYEKIDQNLDFPEYYPEKINDVCLPITLSSINLEFAIAGNNIFNSDVIYKINNFKQTKQDAVECCWLSGSLIENPNEKVRYINQSTLQLVLTAGKYGYFIWNGEDYTEANKVFKSFKHQQDCNFLKQQNYLNYSNCNCKQVYFTPFGHPGGSYEENKSLADFIIEDNFSPGFLNLGEWFDSSNKNYKSSSNFGWFKTNSIIGWGDGSWFCGDQINGNKFYLRKGKKYLYYRSNIKHLDPETNSLPEYIVKYKYNNKKNTVWIKAKKDQEGNWLNDGARSNMTLNAGDILIYSRTPSTFYSLTGEQIENVDVAENRGSIWSNFDYVSLSNSRIITLFYPYNVPQYALTQKQNPKVDITNIIRIVGWEIKGPINRPGQQTFNFKNQASVIFNPVLSGVYTVSMTAVSGNPNSLINLNTSNPTYGVSGLYVFTDIPSITAIPSTTVVESVTSYNTTAPGYVINVPLNGWDYNTNTFNSYTTKENKGAKPYWAKTYNQKDEFTGFKGIESIGSSIRLIDNHNFLSQPQFSDTYLNIGQKVQYIRKYPVKMNWIQPIDFEIIVDKNDWCKLEFNTNDSNLKDLIYSNPSELVVTPTSAKSDISITNIVDNQPVEIFYNALNTFSWQISVTPEISETIYNQITPVLAISANNPWINLSNLNYPTVAVIPTTEDLKGEQEIGGYFKPHNLGATTYINQNYTTGIVTSSINTQTYFEDTSKRYQSRGLTKDKSNSPAVLKSENNLWLKESIVSGSIAGTIKKDIFKKYQKFLPYQSGYESNPRLKLGLITPSSRQSPWGGKEDSEWRDFRNYPVSFTGKLKVSNWSNSQALKQVGLQAENWVTDVFGNQYGLYKNIKDTPQAQRKNIFGEIWTRKNSQFVSSAQSSLSGVFDSYSSIALIDELLGTGVRKIDMFFDTLMIETSGVIIFERINYDYTTDDIYSLIDDARHISLAIPISVNIDREFNNIDLSQYNFAKAGETWFSPQEKAVTISTCSLVDKQITPELYKLNLSNNVLEKIFPVIDDDINLINSLSSENITSIDSPVLSFNSFLNEYLLSVLCKTENNKNLILEMIIKNNSRLNLTEFTIYNSASENLDPPAIFHPLHVYIKSTSELNFQCLPENGPVSYQILNKPSWVNISPEGLFTGKPPYLSETYTVSFIISNTHGSTYYTLYVHVEHITVTDYLITAGYDNINDADGFILTNTETEVEEFKIIVLT
jgi:hypothetical protein